jgi:hypothetical protein
MIAYSHERGRRDVGCLDIGEIETAGLMWLRCREAMRWRAGWPNRATRLSCPSQVSGNDERWGAGPGPLVPTYLPLILLDAPISAQFDR